VSCGGFGAESLVAISWQEALARVSQDAGPFVKLGTSFKSAGTLWIGPVVASPAAVYFIKKYRQEYRGVVGAVLNETIARDDAIVTCRVAELPQAVKTFVGGGKRLQEKDVVVIPRTTVSLVQTSWSGQIGFTAGRHRFAANTSLLTMFRRPGQLRGLGWTLNVPLTPEAASLHGEEGDGSHVIEMPLWKKIAYVVLAVVALVGAIVMVAILKNALG
jgi:hypothetical protein